MHTVTKRIWAEGLPHSCNNEASATVDWQVFEPEQEEEAAAEALEEI